MNGRVRLFLLTPLREGRQKFLHQLEAQCDFYSRPCGRGDGLFEHLPGTASDFYSRPCGRGDVRHIRCLRSDRPFLLTPLREGRLNCNTTRSHPLYFYSRPCGRGDTISWWITQGGSYFYSRPCGRGDLLRSEAAA